MVRPGDISRTLFIISCSAAKNPEHQKAEKWMDIFGLKECSNFPEFRSLRKQLLDFYSGIDSEVLAKEVYRGYRQQNPGQQNPERWEKAWKTNRTLLKSGVSPAIYRYTGRLYAQLDTLVCSCLADNKLTNVLIISALNGPTMPSDFLPHYDLTMKDLSFDKIKLARKWPYWIKVHSSDSLREFLKRFRQIYVMVGNDYKPVAKALRDLAPNVKEYKEAPSFGWKSGSVWGQQLNSFLSTLI